MQKLYEIQITISVNKVSLEHGHIHSFMYPQWLFFCTTTAALSSGGRDL